MVSLASCIVAMVTINAKKVTTICRAVIGQLFDTIIVRAANREFSYWPQKYVYKRWKMLLVKHFHYLVLTEIN